MAVAVAVVVETARPLEVGEAAVVVGQRAPPHQLVAEGEVVMVGVGRGEGVMVGVGREEEAKGEAAKGEEEREEGERVLWLVQEQQAVG